MKTDLFQSCGHWWVFQICWHLECSTFTASSFRVWNYSIGIPSPPLALFTVMLSEAHLSSNSRMSGPRWVITPSWLSGSWRSFFFFWYSSSVYLATTSYFLLLLILRPSLTLNLYCWNVLTGVCASHSLGPLAQCCQIHPPKLVTWILCPRSLKGFASSLYEVRSSGANYLPPSSSTTAIWLVHSVFLVLASAHPYSPRHVLRLFTVHNPPGVPS